MDGFLVGVLLAPAIACVVYLVLVPMIDALWRWTDKP